MATASSFRPDEDGRSAGGKIMRNRRARTTARTPYARPELPAEDSAHGPVNSENPRSWLSGIMLPARMVATGAGKIFSTVFGADSPSSSSSSLDDDSVTESGDKDEVEDGVSHSNLPEKVVPSPIGRSENKHLIQQLVMQEAFSSDEGEELIKLIKSRVVDDDGRLRNIDTRTAVMEAKKWFEEKKCRFGSTSKLEDHIYAFDQAPLTEGETNSPVDVAKSYMMARPAWLSPSLKHGESSTLSPIRTESSTGEISKSILPGPLLLPEANKSSLLTGSWNIFEEVRRVRSKATEELVATTPCEKLDLSNFPLEHKLNEEESGRSNMKAMDSGDETHNSTPAVVNSDNNEASQLAAKCSDRFLESMEVEPDRLLSRTLPANGTCLASNQDNDSEAVQFVEDAEGKAKPAGSDARLEQLDGCSLANEKNGSIYSAAENGLLYCASSGSVADQTKPKRSGKDQEKVDGVTLAENMEVREHPSSADVSNANENENSTVSGSQNNSKSRDIGEPSPYRTRSSAKRSEAEKQMGREYNRGRESVRTYPRK